MSVESAARLFRERSRQLIELLESYTPPATARLRSDAAAFATAEAWVTTGIGASEGPARLLAQVLAARGRPARFAPVTAVDRRLGAGAVVMFSFSLSPNARLAIAGSEHIASRWLITGTASDCSAFERTGGSVLRHPPEKEDGLLVRILAPTLASYAALRVLGGLEPPPGFFDALAAAERRAQALAAEVSRAELLQPMAFVTSGEMHEASHGLRWKWLETLGVCDPPLYDVLNFAHGPLQHWHGRRLMLVALRAGGPHWPALESAAERCGHRLLSLEAALPPPWCFFEHDIALNTLLDHALDSGIGHGAVWRGQGDDVDLYDIGADLKQRSGREGDDAPGADLKQPK